MLPNLSGGFLPRRLAVFAASLVLSACSLGTSGPSSSSINRASGTPYAASTITVVPVDEVIVQRLAAATARPLFSQVLGDAPNSRVIFGRGDVVGVTIWEAPPALLFGSNVNLGGAAAAAAAGVQASGPSGTSSQLPDMMVDDDGRINVPFAGSIVVVGRSPTEVERTITSRLTGKAHQPQVVVRRAGNLTSDVSIVGEVSNQTRMPLTPKGERLLDALAAAGGVRQATSKVLIQVTRADRVAALPLDQILRAPAENIRLQPSDVVSAIYQPYSFTAMGATGTSNEIPFEATGITLSQALGRLNGLREDRANVRGVFVFRFEETSVSKARALASGAPQDGGRVPIIYRLDLGDPKSLFLAQNFPVRDKDIVYVSTAPLSDLQRFMNFLASTAFTVIGLGQAVR